MFRLIPTLTAFGGILVAGLIPGFWAGRWIPATSLDEAAERLLQLPPDLGEWNGRDLAVNPAEQAAAHASGFLRRRYINSRTGCAVTVLVLCGQPGPIALHTPDVCYSGAGFDDVGNVSRYEIPGAAGNRLWVRHFEKMLPTPLFLRVFYGWSANGTWEAPDNPRLAFFRRPILYKLYESANLLIRKNHSTEIRLASCWPCP